MHAGLLPLLIVCQERQNTPTQSAVRPTVVRVVDRKGEPLPGARVIFATAPFTGADRPSLTRTREFKTGPRGIARVTVEPGRIWSAWAVWDGPPGRLSCPMRMNVTPGVPLRLTLEKFEAFRVRWLRLDGWRKKVGKVSSRFIVHPGLLSTERPDGVLGIAPRTDANKLDGFIGASFELPIPDGRETAVRLPPLPLHSYYAVLTDENGGMLDLRYMNPAFHSPQANASVQHLYERANSLKQLSLGEPVAIRGRLRNVQGKPIANADVILRSNRAQCQAERRYRTGVDGSFELVVPYRPKGTFGSWNSRLYVAAPGYVPAYFYRTNPTRRSASSTTLQLRAGRLLSWKLLHATPEDRRPERVLLTTEVVAQRTLQLFTFPIRVSDDGMLRLPSPTPRPKGGYGTFQLFLVRDGRMVPLWVPRPGQRIPDELAIDLARLVDVEVRAAGPRGQPRGGILLVHPGLNVPQSLCRHHVSLGGRSRFPLLPGHYAVSLRSPRRGDGFAAFEVAGDAPAVVRIELEPYRLLSGSVVSPQDEPVPGSTIGVQCAPPGEAPAILRALVGSSNRTLFADEKGHFEAFVTARASEVWLTASGTVGNRHMTTRGAVRSKRPSAIVLTLGQQSGRSR